MRKALVFWFGLICFPLGASDLDTWVANQDRAAKKNLLQNISPPGALRGAVAASPSKVNPNYFYHWVRDAALTMRTVFHLMKSANVDQRNLEERLFHYVDFVERIQNTPNPSNGLGEPKFNMDASAYQEPWGRPQNDGPALRAALMIQFANHLIATGRKEYVERKLYRAGLPAHTVIKRDLEYVSHHWQEPDFDLWEEIQGTHFYTRMVQQHALLQGAIFANQMGDPKAAQWYLDQADAIGRALEQHWSAERGYLLSTIQQVGGVHKPQHLDASVLLAVIHTGRERGKFSISDPKVLATARALEKTFQALYPINRSGPGVGIGRYPEDTYTGHHTSGEGNPWFLLTATFAEYYARLAKIQGDPAYQEKAESYFQRIRHHADPDFQLSEQFNRYTGYQQGARHLTWSYAAFIEAARHRQNRPLPRKQKSPK